MRAKFQEWVAAGLLRPGKSKGGLAKALGIHQSQITRMISGARQIKAEEVKVIEGYLGVPPPGTPKPHTQLLGENSINRLRAEMPSADIPEIDLRAGAGYSGGFGHEENTVEGGTVVSRDAVRAQWGIPLPFLRDELHVRPGRFHILPIRGDSMVDTLFDGDRAGIDLDDIDVSQGGIFALLDDNGSVIVKQVELIHGAGEFRRILCKSRNAQYQPFELTLSDPVRIIGRVACRITRL